MNRRRFLWTASGVAASALVAGCTGGESGNGGGESVSVRVVRDAPSATKSEAAGANQQVTETQSSAITLERIIFQRAPDKGIVVAGDLVNTSDRSFSDATVEVRLYDQDGADDQSPASRRSQVEHDSLDAGSAWQWAVKFQDEPEFVTDYFSVTGRGTYG